jgi:hypothetical protein
MRSSTPTKVALSKGTAINRRCHRIANDASRNINLHNPPGEQLMPLKLNVGLSRKLGLPNYGSVGASCAVELELDPFVFHDAECFQQRAEEAFDSCRIAVENELNKYRPPDPPTKVIDGSEPLAESGPACSATADDCSPPLATSRQVDFAYHLARQIRTLGGQRLKLLAQQLYSRPLEELTTLEASRLIDLLKEVRAGTRSVDEFLAEAAA